MLHEFWLGSGMRSLPILMSCMACKSTANVDFPRLFSSYCLRTALVADMARAVAGGNITTYHILMLSHGKYHHYDIQIKYIANFDHHSSLWPKATTFEKSQRDYYRLKAAIIRCFWRPKPLKSHKNLRFWLPYGLWDSPGHMKPIQNIYILVVILEYLLI